MNFIEKMCWKQNYYLQSINFKQKQLQRHSIKSTIPYTMLFLYNFTLSKNALIHRRWYEHPHSINLLGHLTQPRHTNCMLIMFIHNLFIFNQQQKHVLRNKYGNKENNIDFYKINIVCLCLVLISNTSINLVTSVNFIKSVRRIRIFILFRWNQQKKTLLRKQTNSHFR